MFNPQSLRQDFPILSRQIHGQRLAYLDSAATSQKPQAVISAITDYYQQHNANVHRGVHSLGDESTQAFHTARQQIAGFLGADPSELVITRNTTEALNHVANWASTWLQAGEVILCTEMEHHSNVVPWQRAARQSGARVEYLPVTAEGYLDLTAASEMIKRLPVAILAMTHVSNTLGTINPITELAEQVKKHHPQAKVVVDGAQAAPHMKLSFENLPVDFYALSAHKMLGPMGIGALLVKRAVLEKMAPFLVGGGMIDEVSLEATTFASDLEERFTAGTPDVASLVGWAAACEYLAGLGMSQVQAHDQGLVAYTLEKLLAVPDLTVIGPRQASDRLGSVAFVHTKVHAHDVGQVLDSQGVAARSGHHCTMPLHTKFGWAATTRLSFNVYSDTDDIDQAIAALAVVRQVFSL